MICHYRGVSTQLSPPNHPSYPLSHPPKLYSGPPKTPPAFLRQLRFHSQHCYPICPSFLHSTLRENVPCERHITVSALCRICVLMPQYVSYTIHVYVRAKRFVSIQTANQQRICELVHAVVQKQNPRRQVKHRGLSQVYYICQQQSFITTGHRSHSFPLNAASSGMCECVRQILSH